MDKRQDVRDVLAEGLSGRPSRERYCHRVQKCHVALAIGHQDGIANACKGDVQPFVLLVRLRLCLPALCEHGR